MRTLLYMLLAAAPLAAQPLGLKWDMTPDQVHAAVPNPTVKIDADLWKVEYTFDAGKLTRVELKPADAKNATIGLFLRTERLLFLRYARPLERSDSDVVHISIGTIGHSSRTSTWRLTGTAVTLDFTESIGSLHFLTLTYEPIPASVSLL